MGEKEIYLKLSESVEASSRAIPHDLLPDPLFSGVTCRLPLVGERGSHALNDNVLTCEWLELAGVRWLLRAPRN